MPAGIQIYNEYGVLQVDDTYAAMSCIKSSTATFVQQSDPAHSGSLGRIREQRATVTVAGAVNPVIAIRSNYLCMLYDRQSNGGGNWTFRLDAEAAASGKTFDYYIFDTRPKITSSAGIYAWDASGNLTFSSDTPPMQVVAPISGDSGTLYNPLSANPASHTYGSGRVYAAVPGRVANYTFMANNSLGQGSAGTYRCVKTISNGIHMENKLLWSYSFTNSGYSTYSWHSQIYDLMVVDVTNY